MPVAYFRHQMSTKTSVSVVIPCYNTAQFLPAAVDSVLAQTEPVEEILVVDDGSSDNTREVASRYGSKIKYVFQKNKGLAAARNTGIRESNSDWVAFLDADDWWMPEKISLQKRLIQPNVVLIYTGVLFVNSNGTSTASSPTPPASLWPKLRAMNLITPSTVMVKKDALLELGGFNESIRACEDWELWVRLFPIGSFAMVPKAVTGYRVVSGSLSSNPDRMLNTFYAILDSTLLSGLTGVERAIWRRRAISSQLYSAALIAREGKMVFNEFDLLLKSLLTWPSPLWQGSRFAALVVSTRKRFSGAFKLPTGSVL